MAIPLPGSWANALFEGVQERNRNIARGHQQRQNQQQLDQQQQYQQQNLMQQMVRHKENMALKQQDEARKAEQFSFNQSQKKLEGPAKYDLLQAKIEHERAKTKNASQPKDQSLADRRNQLINSNTWKSMPSSSKENLVALGNGLGIRPDILVQGMTDGRSFEDIAQEHGYNKKDIENVIPKYMATTQNVRMENERQKNLAELNVIENHVTESMAPYIETIIGYSPKQIIDSFKGRNPDKLAKYLAARALQPEIAALRIKVMGGNIGQGAIEVLMHSALGKSRILQGQVTPEVFKEMNRYVADWIGEASKAATQSIYGRGGQSNSRPIESLSDEEFAALKGGN